MKSALVCGAGGFIGSHLVAGNQSSVEEEVLKLLKEKNLSISFAESCTGGLLAHSLSNLPGASQVFKPMTRNELIVGAVGMLLNFLLTLGLTPLFPAPSQSVRDMVESIHEPEGAGPAVVIEAAPEH